MNSSYRMSLERLLDSISAKFLALPRGTTVIRDGDISVHLIRPKQFEICNFSIYLNERYCGTVLITSNAGAYVSLAAGLEITLEKELFEFFPIAHYAIRKSLENTKE